MGDCGAANKKNPTQVDAQYPVPFLRCRVFDGFTKGNSGTIDSVIPFTEKDEPGYYGGLELKTDASGSIGLKWYGGNRQGAGPGRSALWR